MLIKVAIAIICTVLICACKDSDLPPHYFDPNNMGPEITEPLVRAASLNDYKTVEKLLKQGHDVNAQSESGFSALSIAVRYEYEAIVTLLLDHGADVWHVDRFGLHPLEVAVTQSDGGDDLLLIIEALVEAGADPDKRGPTMLRTPREKAKYINAQDWLEAMANGEKKGELK